jgi:hypothetical protein
MNLADEAMFAWLKGRGTTSHGDRDADLARSGAEEKSIGSNGKEVHPVFDVVLV